MVCSRLIPQSFRMGLKAPGCQHPHSWPWPHLHLSITRTKYNSYLKKKKSICQQGKMGIFNFLLSTAWIEFSVGVIRSSLIHWMGEFFTFVIIIIRNQIVGAFLFERERARENLWGGGRGRERILKQTPHWAQSPTQSSIPIEIKSQLLNWLKNPGTSRNWKDFLTKF